MQRYLDTRPTNYPTTGPVNTISSKKSSTDYYRVPLDDVQIHFIDSPAGYERLLDRLFNVDHDEEELLVGFDCRSLAKTFL